MGGQTIFISVVASFANNLCNDNVGGTEYVWNKEGNCRNLNKNWLDNVRLHNRMTKRRVDFRFLQKNISLRIEKYFQILFHQYLISCYKLLTFFVHLADYNIYVLWSYSFTHCGLLQYFLNGHMFLVVVTHVSCDCCDPSIIFDFLFLFLVGRAWLQQWDGGRKVG
jgi:hypothetical protein